MKKKKPYGGRNQLLFMIVRCILGMLIIFSLSGIHFTLKNKMTTTVFLVDMSDSAKAYEKNVTEYLRKTLKDKPEDNQAGIVAFGMDTATEQLISVANSFTEFKAKPISSATNIESAIDYAIAIMPKKTSKRIVVITDGQENIGDVYNIEPLIKKNDIELNFIVLENEEAQEVYVSNLEVPDKINVGETFNIKVTVESNVSEEITLYLYSGRTVRGTQKVKVQTGTNTFVFKDVQEDVGLKNYKVRIEADKDSISMNNEFVAYAMVDTQPRMLVVEGKDGNSAEFVKLLDSMGINYTVRGPKGVPTSINEMNEFKTICLVNVHADDLMKEFKDNIENYVKNYGGSLIATGGDSSFALGQYRGTQLEKVLPVDMDIKGEKEIPKMAMAMVIDHSGSMSADDFGQMSKLTLAKNAAIEALNTLRETDEIGVMQFDDTCKWVVELQNAKDKKTLEEYISGIPLGGGTNIYGAFRRAVDDVSESDAKIKHIILLTDGQDYFTDYDDIIADALDEGITVSTVAVGGDANNDLLNSIAERCDGRAYVTNAKTDIPRIFAQEVFLSSGEYLVNREFYPVVSDYSNIIEEFSNSQVPSLLGYVNSSAKDNAKVLLESDEHDPILSVMQCGLGRTVAFNSDVMNIWTANYAGTEVYQQLWNNIISWSMAEFTSEDTGVSIRENSGKLNITYNTESFDINSDVIATITDEEGNVKEKKLSINKPGEYVAEIDAYNTGIYTINIKEELDGELTSAINTNATIQYSKEYRVFEYSDDFKNKISNMKANSLTLKDNVFKTKLKQNRDIIDISDICLIIAVILFAIDILFRRLQLQKYMISLASNYVDTISTNKEARKLKEKEKLQKKQKEEEEKLKELKKAAKADKKATKKYEEAKLKAKDSFNKNNTQRLDTKALLDRKNKRY
ncbi:MAG: VWA domain-containing protein [Lachnospiraceae bacterium]|nr:VWA domain-containing protein [Lachnospiraceae bacterium]